jgi:hypothetical protein
LKSLETTLKGPYEKAAFDARAQRLHTLATPYAVGGNGQMGEAAPFTFLEDATQFREALNSAELGLIPAADAARQAVVSALAE